MTLSAQIALDERKLADQRFIGDLLGTYVLRNKAVTEDGLQVFTCRARSISAREAVLNAPVAGAIGDPLTVNFQGLGLLKGEISRVMADGFSMRTITASSILPFNSRAKPSLMNTSSLSLFSACDCP